MKISLDHITSLRANLPNWNRSNATKEGREEWEKDHYLCRYKIICPVQNRGICEEPVFGFAEEDENYVYCYSRGNFKTNFRQHKLGGVIVFPKEDYKLITLECPDMFTSDPKENKLLDSTDAFFNYPSKDFNDSLMTYDKFLLHYTLGAERAFGSAIDLRYKYIKYNKAYFEGKLPYNIKIMWDTRPSVRGGQCRIKTKNNRSTITSEEIGISVKYIEKFPYELEGTVLHEMIHVLLPFDHHNNNFKYYMVVLSRESGIEITQYTVGRVKEKVINWVYMCRKCGKVYKNTRRTKDINSICCGVRGCRGTLDEMTYEYYQQMYE